MSLFVMGPAACNNLGFNLFGTPSYDADGKPLGFLFNSDINSNILGGIRLENGSSVYVYGTRNEDGSFKEITGAVIQDLNGQEASVTFENGLPKNATSFDGSTIEMTYEEVSVTRLKGHVDIHFTDPEVAEGERDQSFDFDVDLEEAAAELARHVQELLGLSISPEEPPDSDARVRLPDASSLPPGKDADNAQFILGLMVLPFQMAFVSIGFGCIQVMTQLVACLVGTIVEFALTLTAVIISAVFSPFIIMCDMMRMAFILAPIQINIGLEFDID